MSKKSKKRNNKSNKNKSNGRINSINKVYKDELSVTKQQQFDFDDLELTSTLDTSFVAKKGTNKVTDETVDKFNYLEDIIVRPRNNPTLICILIFIIILLGGFLGFHFLTFNHNKVKVVTKEKAVKVVDDNYLFLGDSITDYYDLDKYYKDLPVINSGISGNATGDILNDMNNRVYQYNPSKVFLLIGTNDIQREIDDEKIISNIEKIIENIKENRSYAEIYLESIYPVNEEKSGAQIRKNSTIKSINKKLKEYCRDNGVIYIDLFSKLIDSDSDDVKLSEMYSKDGLHLTSEGYKVVTKEIKKYLNDK